LPSNRKLQSEKNNYKNITGPNPISSWHLCSDFYPAIFEGEITRNSSGEYWLHNVIPSRSVTQNLMTCIVHRVPYANVESLLTKKLFLKHGRDIRIKDAQRS